MRDWLNEVRHVHWHLLNLSVVERLDIVQVSLVVQRDKVDGNSFTTESTSTANSETSKQGTSQYVTK